ncbi:MAG TPA: 2-phospho-L-lactate transferase [Acidimicrobiales bacterium]|nr:2-phospho-L-lactate transferase [Acidimicrobiales bacterium]
MLTVLCGGVGAARFLVGATAVVDAEGVTAIVNVGDDTVVHGLHVSPDLDTVIYTLAGVHNDELGWGLAGESWRVMDELAALGGPTWFRLGDRDLATHLYRTGRLAEGATLSDVTAELAAARGVRSRIVPVSDDPVATFVTTDTGERLDFQEYFVARRHDVTVASIEFDGARRASPAPGVLEAIGEASAVVVAPSNPLVSIDPVLAVPGVRAAVQARRADALAISPIVAGAALKGPADRLLADLGHEPTALGVARHYRELVGTFVLDERDAALRSDVESLGLRCVVTDTVMRDPQRAASLAKVVLGG